ncbi:murein hydrolase activator EnvC family protein [Vibrio sp. VPAP30]|uniref:murein hydrolase activator EnvC family protein n=1 Tax=Vibrio sp. VPAP30 TaxID=1647102 RepID=UPI0006593F4E|nr:murein hydrolase activator EnvC [Vibrio sp. VPAP30]KLN67173.1 peptidase M23 [Vibrio sp. VPAP30]
MASTSLRTLFTSKIYLALGLMLSAYSIAPSYAANNNELKGVSGEISRQKQSLSSQKKKLDSLQKSLKSQEITINRLEKEIKETKASLNHTNKNIANLKSKVDQLKQNKKAQSDKLAELIQTYYVTQRAKASSNILNQGVEEDRISQYFQHLAKERATTIAELEKTAEELEDSREQLGLEKQQITSLLNQQTKKRDQLTKTQSKRKGTVSQIRSSISNDKVYLSELQRNETRLKAEIAKAAKRNAVPMDGLARKKGKLPWPLKGRVLHNYGSRQTGQINWKGMVINANYGQSVKAVYSGTVVFADYLRGYGLVILLDHGKGDMTLYGFNQSLLKKEGDKVTAGESIALAGDTGGQPRPSLYFEIRRNSKTQNPKSWLTR